MEWKPPSDAVETSSLNKSFTPPVDAVEVKKSFVPPSDVEVVKNEFTPPVDSVETTAVVQKVEPVQQKSTSRFAPSPNITKQPSFNREKLLAAEYEKEKSYSRFYEDEETFNKINKYAIARFGKSEQLKKGETKEEYINRWASHMRMVGSNMISARGENEWLNTASQEDKMLAGEVYKEWKDTASAFSGKGQKGAQPYVDTLKSVVDVSLPISLGVGNVAARTFMSTASKVGGPAAAARTAAGATSLAATPVVEGVLGATANSYEQKIKLNVADAKAKEMRKIQQTLTDSEKAEVEPEIQELENSVKEGVSFSEMAKSGLLSGTFGIIEPAVLMSASRGVSKAVGGELTLDGVLNSRKQQTAAGVPTSTFTGNPQADELTSITTDILTGKDLLSKQGDPTVIAEMQIKNSIDKQADLIASAIWKQLPEFAPKAGEATFDAVKRTLEVVDTLADDVVESALLKEGIEIKPFIAQLKLAGLEEDALTKFAAMYGTSTSDAARTLQSKSVISRLLNKASALNPEVAKEVDILFGKSNPIVDSASYLRSAINRFDKNQITAMTLNVSTMLTNAWGSATNLTFGVAEDGLESAIFRVGKALGEKMSGKPITGSVKDGMAGVMDDALNTYFYMGQAGLSKEVSEKLLENSPALAGKMLVTAAETANSDLYKFVQVLNTPAVIMDSFTRRAVFSASVDESMRRAGLNMYDFILENKPIPIDILRKGVDDSLLFTFSKSPTNAAGKAFVDIVEATRPVGTLAFPFARFLTNTVRWSNQHFNPLLAASGTYDLGRGINMMRKGDDEGLRLIQDGAAELSKVGVGAGILAGALSYREKNQDTSWSTVKSSDGSVDIKNLAPLNIPFAIADYWIKTKNGNAEDFNTKELAEAILGIKTGLIGTQQIIVDRLRDWAGSQDNDDVSRNKLSVLAGEFLGSYFGRSTVPLNQVSAVITSYDRNESLPRDANILKEGEERGFGESFTKQIVKGIPILKQTLPTYQSATRVETPYRDTALFKQFTGLSFIPPKNTIETEIERLKIQPQAVFSSTGSKTTDAQAKKRMAEYLPFYVDPILSSEQYQKLPKDAQNLVLTKVLGNAQRDAKKAAVDLSIAAAYNDKKVPLIEQETFEKLPSKVRRLTLDLFEQQFGVGFTESTDFQKYGKALALSSIIKDQPFSAAMIPQKSEDKTDGFATGGYLVGKALKNTASDLLEKKSSDLLQRMQQMAAKNVPEVSEKIADEVIPAPKAVVPTKTLSAQTVEAIPTTKPPVLAPTEAPRTVSKAVKPAEVAPSIDQTEAAFPAVSGNKAVDAPVPETPAVFSEYQMQEAEKLLTSKMGSKYQLDAYKKSDPEAYQQSINKLAGEIEPPAKVEPVATTKPTRIEEINSGYAELPAEQQTIMNSNLNKPKFAVDMGRKNETLSKLRTVRNESFSVLKEDPVLVEKGISPDAIAVAQGDWRLKNKRELDVNNPADVEDFSKFVESYQQRLDALREQYKDHPPKILYHGSSTERTPEKINRGFFAPQSTTSKMHSELGVGAPSFTSDLRLNYNIEDFGGKRPSHISMTEMPYADYLFRKIDVPFDVYKNQGSNMNILAQTITGSPDVARPLGLQRSLNLRETEDAFVEADKLKMKVDIPSVEKQFKVFEEQEKVRADLFDKLKKDRNAITSSIGTEKQQLAANKAYTNIRELFKNEVAQMSVSTKNNQTMLDQIELLAKSKTWNLMPLIDDTIDVLKSTGSKDKAMTLKDLRDQLKVLQASRMPKASLEKGEVLKRDAALNNVIALVGGNRKVPARLTDSEGPASQYPKNIKRLGLAKGGLASRR